MTRVPQVAVLYNSVKDANYASRLTDVFRKYDIPYLKALRSASREPQSVLEFVEVADRANIEIFVCISGYNQLPLLVTSKTVRPVIYVPVTRSEDPSELAALTAVMASIVTPFAQPLFTVGINQVDNAAFAVISCLGVKDRRAQDILKEIREDVRQKYHMSSEVFSYP